MGPAPILLFYLLCSVHQISVVTLVRLDREEEINNVLKNARIYNPTGNERHLAGMVVDERLRGDKYIEEVGIVQAEKKHVQDHLNSFIFPITVAYYAIKIEGNCAGVQFTIPESVKSLQPIEKKIAIRTHKWKAIMKTRRNNDYVACLVTKIKDHFREKYEIEKTVDPEVDSQWKDEFDDYLMKFCGAVVDAIETRNSLADMPYLTSGDMTKLNKFDSGIDEYLSLFYNALLGSIRTDDIVLRPIQQVPSYNNDKINDADNDNEDDPDNKAQKQ